MWILLEEKIQIEIFKKDFKTEDGVLAIWVVMQGHTWFTAVL